MGRYDGLRRTLLPLLYRFPSIRPYGRNSHFSLLLKPIYRTLEGWSYLPLPNFIFIVSRVEVCQEPIFSSN
jgi:hypothetical protein